MVAPIKLCRDSSAISYEFDWFFSTQKMEAVDVPIYDFSHHKRSKEVRRVDPADVVLVEGILVLAMDSVREFMNMKIFVDTDDDVRLARR